MATVDPATANTIWAGAVVIGGMVCYFIGVLTSRHCYCGKCAFHVNERRMHNETQRAKRHTEVHDMYRIPWGDERCGQCKLGYTKDNP